MGGLGHLPKAWTVGPCVLDDLGTLLRAPRLQLTGPRKAPVLYGSSSRTSFHPEERAKSVTLLLVFYRLILAKTHFL